MLPKLSQPLYEVTQPSTGNVLRIRPFLVKEEKILLNAKEAAEPSEIYVAIKQIITNCVQEEDFDVDDIPIFDMEYLFIKLRAVSVSPQVKFKVQDSNDGIEYDLELDLNDVEIQFDETNDKKIMLTDDVGIMMKYPTPALSEKIKHIETEADLTTATIHESIDYVFDSEDNYPWKEVAQKEKDEFLDNLSIDSFKKIQKFYETSPKIEHVVTYENSEGTEKRVVFRDLTDFFTLG